MSSDPLPQPDNALTVLEVLTGPNSPKIFYAALGCMAALIVALPFTHRSEYFALVAFLSGAAAFMVAALRDVHASWFQWLCHPNRLQRSDWLTVYDSAMSNRYLRELFLTACGAMILSSGEGFLIEVYRSGGLAWTLTWVFLGSMLFPISAVPGLLLSRNLKVTRRAQQEKLRLIPKMMRNMKLSLRTFLTCRYPYISAYMGFFFYCFVSSFHPNGLGAGIAGWLQASAVDANIVENLNAHLLMFDFAVYGCVALTLFGALRPLAVRLSASYQILANRLVVNRDNLLEAIVETATVKASRIALPEGHPHLSNVYSIILWVMFCYAALFFLVASCPGNLGLAITNWLSSGLYQTFRMDLDGHNNVRLFLASVIAAMGCVPVAVMSCSFLPGKKPKSLLVSSQGVLCPDSVGTVTGQSPLKLWADLKKVSVSNADKPEKQILRLSFGSGGTIKLKTSEFQPELVAELLSSADEYATACKFEAEAVDYRAKLGEDSKRAASVTQVNKFSSTIFTPRKGGDWLKNGEYRIVRKLAGKPLSAVYLARDREENHVVIKEFVLPTCVQQCERMDATFDREYQILRSLNHERIARVIDTFEEKGAKYIVIEHIRGQDLRSLVARRGNRSEKVVLRWAVEIAALMRYLHEREPTILHRDLTPDNLMEDEDGTIQLIDFGAAHQFMEGVTGTLIGKQCYIAPEQLRGKPTVRSDIYSFGCTLQFLLTGGDPPALQQSDPKARNVQVSDVLRNMIIKCTEFDQSARYGSFAQIIQELKPTAAPAGEKVCLCSASTEQPPKTLAQTIRELAIAVAPVAGEETPVTTTNDVVVESSHHHAENQQPSVDCEKEVTDMPIVEEANVS